MPQCPLCDMELPAEPVPSEMADRSLVNCPNCGRYQLDGLLRVGLPDFRQADPRLASIASHVIHRMQRDSGNPPVLDQASWDLWTTSVQVPSPFEQADNLLLWLANESVGVGELHHVDASRQRAAIGVVKREHFVAVLDYLFDQELLTGSLNSAGATAGLSFEGWRRVGELRRTSPQLTRRCFMAMRFSDTELDRAYVECFRPAVKKAGFDLRRIDENAPAGLIDNRLRVEILRARFMIADLTDANPGAYWEAGYAEGLGKPVIYTCRRDHFESRRTHFDTNHHLTVLWEPGTLDDARRRIADTIRATLPAEAKLANDDA